MKLIELFKDIADVTISGEWQNFDVSSITSDSRQVEHGSIFVALPGVKEHGKKFIPQAVAKGAKVIVKSSDDERLATSNGVLWIDRENPCQELARLLNIFYKNPSRQLKVIGVTGTNGKTTITYLLEAIFQAAHKRTGVIGTVNHRFAQRTVVSKNTTPGLVENYSFLSQMLEAGSEYCVMEVSSHALEQNRVAGIHFRNCVFTNLTQDHLDYHKDHESYFQAKAKLFTKPTDKERVVINRDDVYGKKLVKMTDVPAVTYGINQQSDVMAQEIKMDVNASTFVVLTADEEFRVRTPLIGIHNVYNILAATAVALGEGIAKEDIQAGLENLAGVPGRLERVVCGQNYQIFVDYAHTEDALFRVLECLQQMKSRRIILVFGCGGDRDKGKRSKMGAVAGKWADFSFVTNDNPRGEDPQLIIEMISKGFSRNNYEIIYDRREAIKQALAMAQKDDIVLVAGKGHEDYQILKNQTIPFDDRKVIRDYLLGNSKTSRGLAVK